MKQPDESDVGREDYSATYCPEDNKLRLYTGRVERQTFEWLREVGYTSTPKQDCAFVATWTPAREDAALLLIADGDDIGDEDQSPEDRAADRAERFSGYRDKRRDEAHGFADRYSAAPDAYGYQNAQKAERAAARRDRTGNRACGQWSKAEYWQSRTAGVISHALHVSSARVRRSRILRLEAEERKILGGIEDGQKRFDLWEKVLTLPGLDETSTRDESGKLRLSSAALVLAYRLAGSESGWQEFTHPRTGRVESLYSHLTNPADPITAREAATFYLSENKRPAPGRWAAHYAFRLAYERQMLEAEGGSAGNVEMEPGGMLGRYLIVKVNKSNATGAVVSVNVHSPTNGNEGYQYGRRGDTMLFNIQRMGEDVYSPPTEESLGQLAEFRREEKAKTKKANEGTPKLISPTLEDAKRLQAIWNAASRYKASEVVEMTQAEWSNHSKGTYANGKTVFLGSDGNETYRQYYGNTADGAVCKVRRFSGGMSAGRVVVITDKPQSALPDWSSVEVEASK